MAAAFDRKVSENNAGSGNSIAFGLAGAYTAGEFVVIWVACDNAAGTNLPTISDVTWRGASQTFSVVAQHDANGTSAGSATRGFIIVIPSLAGGGAGGLFVFFSDSVSKSVGISAVFTNVTDTVSVGPDSTTGNVLSLPSVPAGDLVLVLTDCETNAALTGDSDTTGGAAWTGPGGDGAVFTTGGGAASNISMLAEYKIPTSTATQGYIAGGFANQGGACGVVLGAGDGISPSGIASAEAFGTAVITTGPVDVAPSGIASAEAFGTPQVGVEQFITATGIPAPALLPMTAEQSTFETGTADWVGGFGSATVAQSSDVAHGGTYSMKVTWTTAGGHGSSAAICTVYGEPGDEISFSAYVYVPSGQPSVYLSSFFDTEGTPSTKHDEWELLTCTGTVRAEGFIQPAIANNDSSDGTNYCYVDDYYPGPLGIPRVAQITYVVPGGIASGEAFGSPTVDVGPVDVSPSGIASAEAFGTALVGSPFLFPSSIDSTEAFGFAQVDAPVPEGLVWLATTPSRRAQSVAGKRPFNRMQMTQGVTWYRIGDTWYQVNNIEDDQVADEVYLGGYDHVVTYEKAVELEALGFTIRTEIR